MKIIFSIFLFLSATAGSFAQAPGHIDKKTKELIIAPNQKTDYTIFGYRYANNTTQEMICFSSNSNVVREDDGKCPLGAYFNTNLLKEGDKIVFMGFVGNFGKMNFISGSGKKTIFYMPKSGFSTK